MRFNPLFIVKYLFFRMGNFIGDGFYSQLKELQAKQMSEQDGQETQEVPTTESNPEPEEALTDFGVVPLGGYVGHSTPAHRFIVENDVIIIHTELFKIVIHNPEHSIEKSMVKSVYDNHKVGGLRWQ